MPVSSDLASGCPPALPSLLAVRRLRPCLLLVRRLRSALLELVQLVAPEVLFSEEKFGDFLVGDYFLVLRNVLPVNLIPLVKRVDVGLQQGLDLVVALVLLDGCIQAAESLHL